MSKVNREELLRELESVLPGLSTREIIEQSSCFIFKDGQVKTFNDEISCSYKTSLNIEGAVVALPFISILRKIPDENIEIVVNKTKDNLIIKGKSKRTKIRMEKEILLAVENIEDPGDWFELPVEFADAVSVVQHCAGKDQTKFKMTCIHICPKWVEACDNFQAARYKVPVGCSKDFLVRKDSLKHIVSLNMTEISETESWVHFRNPAGLILSCRRFIEDYPSLKDVLKINGIKTLLPKGIKEICERGEVFSVDNAEENEITVSLLPNKLKIVAEGVNGKHTEFSKIKYKGAELSFTISPKLLAELVQKHNEVILSKSMLHIKVGKFNYVTVLGVAGGSDE